MIKKNSDCAAKLKILADDKRLAVVRELASGAKSVSELQKLLAIEQSLLSHHLRTLSDADFVINFRRGKNIFYQLSDEFYSSINKGIFDLGCCELQFEHL